MSNLSVFWKDLSSADALAALSMLDHLLLFPEELAMTASTNIDPSTLRPDQYKDHFTVPSNYDEAWDHPCPFQRNKWHTAIKLELAKMNERTVWKLFKLANIPNGRRPVKCKWVLDIKRDGRFQARLVACGYSQVGGVDSTQVFSPVVNDVTFRIILLA